MSAQQRQYWLYGASGYMGGLVAKLLLLRGAAVTLAGRSAPQDLEFAHPELSSLPYRQVAAHDSDALRAEFGNADVAINCAGPLGNDASCFVEAAIAARVPLIDTYNDQHYLRRSFERLESRARHAETTIVSSMGFRAALGDWLAAHCAQTHGAENPHLRIGYMTSGLIGSRGMRHTMLESLDKHTLEWGAKRWREVPAAAELRKFQFPEPFGLQEAISFPSGEVITLPRHIDAKSVRSFVVLGQGQIGRILGRVANIFGGPLHNLRSAVGGSIAEMVDQTMEFHRGGPTIGQRHSCRFVVQALAKDGFRTVTSNLSGFDPYGVCAQIVVLAAEAVQDSPKPGILAPSELIAPSRALTSLVNSNELFWNTI